MSFGCYRRCARRPPTVLGGAALPEVASPLVDRFIELLRSHGVQTQTGQFGVRMKVRIHNDGPVTIWLENKMSSSNQKVKILLAFIFSGLRHHPLNKSAAVCAAWLVDTTAYLKFHNSPLQTFAFRR
ncbi:D-aminoacyl-tRNA deacylase [Candidatus Villigracilis proximus]|uniref:D-aminoacyl-tRNA deacylase n=1 Tax=Candidatus Villigracilis proximus TaxID=3140683 RepID=UPI0031EEEF1E